MGAVRKIDWKIEPLEPRRMLAAGDLDLTFGVGGKVMVPVPAGASIYPQAVIGAPGGKFLMLDSYSDAISQPHPRVTRLNADGSVDTTFGTGGHTAFFWDSSGVKNSPGSLHLTPQGQILVTGETVEHISGQFDWTVDNEYLARLDANGALDTTFGTGGIQFLVENDDPGIVAAQPDGKIVLLKSNDITRLNTDGTTDSGFGAGGKVTIAYFKALVRANGKIVLLSETGDAAFPLAVSQLNPGGSYDTSFGNGGTATFVPPPRATGGFSQVIEDGGNLVIALDNAKTLGAMRLTSTGQVDDTFGVGGVSTVYTADEVDTSYIAVDSQGRLILTGDEVRPVAGAATVAVRLNSDGAFDPSFGRVQVGAADAYLYFQNGMAVQPDGSIVLAATSNPGLQLDYPPEVLFKFSGGGTGAGQVRLSGSTLEVAGTDGSDVVNILGSRSDDPDNLIGVTALINAVGKEFNVRDVSLVDVSAGDGNDIVVSSNNRIPAIVSGGAGDDKILGASGDDSLSGNAGRDQIDGGAGNDRLAGNGGRDKITGGTGDDRLYGGSSADFLAGEGGNDTLYGEGGNDRLSGGPGTDLLHGNGGDDSFFAQGDSAADQVLGDGGDDAATADTIDELQGIERQLL